jgi:hypothetical protein
LDGLQSVIKMKRIILFSITIILVGASLWAQSNQTQSLTFTTYYPAPYGVYRALRLLPNNAFNPGDDCGQEGDVSFHQGTSELYACKGLPGDLKWKSFGSGGIAGNIIKTDNGVIADTCGGTLKTPDALSRTCSVPFYKDIIFDTLPPFSGPPRVLVTLQWVTNSWNPQPGIWDTNPRTNCAASGTDRFIANATNITATGFRLWASGSPEGGNCGGGEYYSHAYAGWIAIGN